MQIWGSFGVFRLFSAYFGHWVYFGLSSNRCPEWLSMTAVSLNVVGGVRRIKPAKVYMCTQTQRGQMHDVGCTRPWIRTAEPFKLLRKLDYNKNIFFLFTNIEKTSNRKGQTKPFVFALFSESE